MESYVCIWILRNSVWCDHIFEKIKIRKDKDFILLSNSKILAIKIKLTNKIPVIIERHENIILITFKKKYKLSFFLSTMNKINKGNTYGVPQSL